MAKKTEPKTEKVEREYIIPLRARGKAVPRYKKTPKAIKTIKEFLVRHMKIKDRDLSKIKIDKYLNEQMWFRGIKRPPHKIKIKAVKEKGIVKVELVNYSENLKFKKLREIRKEKIAEEVGKKKKAEKKVDTLKGTSEKIEEKEKTEKEKIEEKEKAKAGEEVSKQIEKQKAKQIKHEVGGKKKQKTQPVRKALAK